MARIPSADGLGDSVAQPTHLSSAIPGSQFGAPGLEYAGRIVNDMAAVQREEEQRAQATRDAADRAQAHIALTTAQDDLKNLNAEIVAGVKDGTIDKKQAASEWQRRANELMSPAMQNVPEAHRSIVASDINARIGAGGRDVLRAVTDRDQADVRTGLDSVFEQAARRYSTDPAGADEMVRVAVENLGPHSGIAPDKLSKAVQTWRENAQYTAGYESITAARGNMAALDAAEKKITALGDMDPQKRAQLLDRVTVYKTNLAQQQEIAAARAAREQERRMRQAQAEFETFQGLQDKGSMLNPEYVDHVRAATEGTPYHQGVMMLLEQQSAVGGLAAQPIAMQRATLDSIDAQIAQSGRTPELDRRRGQIEKVLKASEDDLQKDPMRAAVERGVIPGIEPVNLTNPEAIAQTISARAQQASMVSTWAGRTVSPLTSQESDQLAGMLGALPAKERAVAIARLSSALDPKTSAAVAAQIDPKDHTLALAFALGGDMTNMGRPTAELVLKGAQAIKDKTAAKDDSKLTGWRATIARELDGVYPNEKLTASTVDAAYYIAAGMAHENGGSISGSDLERAIGLATRATLVEHNGRRMPIPYGWKESDLETALRSTTEADVTAQSGAPTVRAAGVQVPAADFVKSLPGAELMFAGPGRYTVIVSGRPVMSADGKRPIVVKVQ